ncbi:MAG TPA: trypsin-like peptidase domain-containing protein [Myxococcota bacterium]|jgi:serine protease Do
METKRLACAVAVLAVCASGAYAGSARAEPLWTDPAQKRAPVNIPSVAPLVDKLEPAVLVIFTQVDFDPATDLPPGHPPLPEGMPFPFEGPDDPSMPREETGQGAGFLITPTGYALTNNHVVERAKSISVRVGEGHDELSATVVGVDEKTDIALIKLDSPRKDWPVIPLGDSDVMKVGDFVVAIGSPFGLAQSVSVGIVSGRSRRDIEPSNRAGLYDFIQTDASINPGNSGGPLLNLYGEVIGINAAVNAAGSGIGFAIPINMVKKILPALKDKGHYPRSWLGVQITAVTKDVAKGFGLDRVRGALVREVVPDAPAAQAGVEPGDVITAFDGKVIEDSYQLPLLAGEAGVGKSVKLEVMRDGKPKVITMVLGGYPDEDKKTEATVSKKSEEKDGTLGVVVVTLESVDRDRLKLKPEVAGTLVTKVRPGSPAFIADIHVDDVLIEVNKKSTRTANDFAAIVKETPSQGVLKIKLRRGASTVFIALAKP